MAAWTDETSARGTKYQRLIRSTGLIDERGRAVGGVATVWVHKADPTAGYCGPWLQDGFRLDVIATRNGIRYGALTRDNWFTTAEEARVAGERKLSAQAKRYARKYQGDR